MKTVISKLLDKIVASRDFGALGLHFIDMKTDEERFAAGLNILSAHDIVPEAKCEFKDTKKSADLRNKANRMFLLMKDNIQESRRVCALYTESIAIAPDMSEELSISYANRSAVLMCMGKYKDCIEDINRALNMTYPNHLKGKLLFRKAECLIHLKESYVENIFSEIRNWLKTVNLSSSEKEKYEEKLISISRPNNGLMSKLHVEDEIPSFPTIYHPHKNIPCASNAMQLNYSQQFGKHLVANRDINIGEILIIEKPYVSIFFPEQIYTHCAFCLKIAWAAIPCKYCIYAVFCSEKCKKEAWTKYHNIECSIFGCFVNSESQQTIMISIRIIILAVREAGSIKKLKEYIKNIDNCKDLLKNNFANDGLFHNEKYESVYTLRTHTEKRSTIDVSVMTYYAVFINYYLFTKTNFYQNQSHCNLKSMSMNKDAIFIGGLLLRHLQTYTVNASYHYQYSQGDIENVGTFLTGFFSLLNHSCIANTSMCSSRGDVIVFAVLPINKGSQIYYNYGIDKHERDYLTRTQKLRNQFYFECTCIACTRKNPLTSLLQSNDLMLAINEEDKILIYGLMDKSNFYQKSLLEGTITDKEKAIKDVSNIIEALVKRTPLLHYEILYVTDILKMLFFMKYGVSY